MQPEEAGEDCHQSSNSAKTVAVHFYLLSKNFLLKSISSAQRLMDNRYLPLGSLTSLPDRDIPAEQKAS